MNDCATTSPRPSLLEKCKEGLVIIGLCLICFIILPFCRDEEEEDEQWPTDEELKRSNASGWPQTDPEMF